MDVIFVIRLLGVLAILLCAHARSVAQDQMHTPRQATVSNYMLAVAVSVITFVTVAGTTFL